MPNPEQSQNDSRTPVAMSVAAQRIDHMRHADSHDAVGTTGAWHIKSNAINAVPKEARIEVDIRDIDGRRRDRTVKSVQKKAKVSSPSWTLGDGACWQPPQAGMLSLWGLTSM